MQFDVYVWLMILLHISPNVVTQVINNVNRTEPICSNGYLPYANINHTKLYYEAALDAQVDLPTYEDGQHNLSIYWFVVKDFCDVSLRGNTFFVTIYPNNTFDCLKRDDLSISVDSCNNNYNFTRQSMIINILTNTTTLEYIRFYGKDRRELNLTSAVSYSITISHFTTLVTTNDPTTILSIIVTFKISSSLKIHTLITTNTLLKTYISTDQFSTESSILSSIDTTIELTSLTELPSRSPDLKIILPIVLVSTFGIISIIAGFFYYRRRKRNKKSGNFTTDTSRSEMDWPSDNQPEAIYCDDITKLEADNGYTIWRPVQQKM